MDDESNISLFAELCARLHLCALNSLEDVAKEDLVTYRDLGTKIGDPIIHPHYAQLDYILGPSEWRSSL